MRLELIRQGRKLVKYANYETWVCSGDAVDDGSSALVGGVYGIGGGLGTIVLADPVWFLYKDRYRIGQEQQKQLDKQKEAERE